MKHKPDRNRFVERLKKQIEAGEFPQLSPLDVQHLDNPELEWSTSKIMDAIDNLDPLSLWFPRMLLYKHGVETSVGFLPKDDAEDYDEELLGKAIKQRIKDQSPSSIILEIPVCLGDNQGTMIHAEMCYGTGKTTFYRYADGSEQMISGQWSRFGRLLWHPNELKEMN